MDFPVVYQFGIERAADPSTGSEQCARRLSQELWFLLRRPATQSRLSLELQCLEQPLQIRHPRRKTEHRQTLELIHCRFSACIEAEKDVN